VTTKKPKTGGEIDAYCTKCRLDLTHRIIAMVGDVVKKVECKTCGSHHLYRRPKTERDAALARLEKKAEERSKASSGAPTSGKAPSGNSKAAREARAERAERELTHAWEHAIAGQPSTAFKPYRITVTFAPGDLVRHSKFGDGVVQKILDAGKVEILFKDGPRTMAQGQVLQ
jgi:hypothetical protein